MDLTRLFRVVRARWYLVILITVVTVAAGYYGTIFWNERIVPTHVAVAPVTFPQPAAEDDRDATRTAIEQELTDAQTLATEVNQTVLTEAPTLTIEASLETAELLFRAVAGTDDRAQELAEEMRQRYLDAQPIRTADELDAKIREVDGYIDSIRSALGEFATAAVFDPVEERRLQLGAVLESVRAEAETLQQELLLLPNPDEPERTEEIVTAELEKAQAAVVTIQTELAALPPVADPEFSESETQRQVLEDQYAALVTQYQALLTARQTLIAPPEPGTTLLSDQTAEPLDPSLLGALGVIVGLVGGAVLVIAGDRLRRVIWVPAEVQGVPVLVSLEARRTGVGIWYDRAIGDRRRTEIQALRAGLAGRLRSRRSSIAITGHHNRQAARLVAADLAVSFAHTGRNVLLIDAEFGVVDQIPEFGSGSFTLAQLLVELRAGIPFPLDRIPQIRPGLWAVRAGEVEQDPGDLLTGDIFDRMVAASLDRFDSVIVAGGDAMSTVGQEAMTRTEAGLVVLGSGRSRVNEFQALADELAARGANLMGTVLLVRRPTALRTWLDRAGWLGHRRKARLPVLAEPVRSDVSEPAVVMTLPAGTHEAFVPVAEAPSESASPNGLENPRSDPDASWFDVPVQGSRLRDLLRASVGGGLDTPDEEMVEALVSGLIEAGPEKSYGPISEFIMDLVEELMLHPERLGSDHDGMLPLHPVKNMSTVGNAISRHLAQELGNRKGAILERQIVEVLFGAGPLKSVAVLRKSIDAWLSVAFFRIHTARTGREPSLWHLVSPERYFQVFVDGRKFDRERLRELSDVVLPMFIDDVERQQRAAKRFGSHDAVALLDRAIIDARTLIIQLGWLTSGSDDRSRLHYPWSDEEAPNGWNPRWAEGVRPNLAPIQRMGLLAIPVLTEEELDTFATKA